MQPRPRRPQGPPFLILLQETIPLPIALLHRRCFRRRRHFIVVVVVFMLRAFARAAAANAFFGAVGWRACEAGLGVALAVPQGEEDETNDEQDASGCGADCGASAGAGAEGAGCEGVEGSQGDCCGRHDCGVVWCGVLGVELELWFRAGSVVYKETLEDRPCSTRMIRSDCVCVQWCCRYQSRKWSDVLVCSSE